MHWFSDKMAENISLCKYLQTATSIFEERHNYESTRIDERRTQRRSVVLEGHRWRERTRASQKRDKERYITQHL